ncbi:hypothetical protein BC343_20665 [Mucilaginibacter pedocola]|uniref:Uncharacterized protein n=1 Tax=Mucilaginibacter pedocola TaxID=1792845 RepID=A0A1S9PLG6_9SPHI|nr:hypothetical protein BC343_20665 [Mucilaginibacter pedocola]
MLDQLYLFFEALAFIVSVIQLPRLKNTAYKYFAPYLLFILVYEFGTINRWFGINGSNLWAANITLFIFFLFYSLFLRRLIKTPVFKKWVSAAILLSVFCSIINNIFFQGFFKLDSATILLQFAILVIITCVYFYELMNYTHVHLSIVSLPGFWLNTGLLFFCLVNFLIYASFAFLAYQQLMEFNLLFTIVANLAIAILYSCLTVSFLCARKVNSLL